jgi:trimeric autotransporter adhesin
LSNDDSGTIQIGTQGTQTAGTYIAGIYGATATSALPVYVNSNGQLGTVLSSRRFKEQIADMGDSSSKLLQLRPVTFFYKPEYDDGSHQLQYGLIAEEVAKVYPEMVAYDKDGLILTVKYQLLAPMLLNEVRKQNDIIRQLQGRLAALEELVGKVPTATATGQ